jgi:hypothetical protein
MEIIQDAAEFYFFQPEMSVVGRYCCKRRLRSIRPLRHFVGSGGFDALAPLFT